MWRYTVGGGFGQRDRAAYAHPATFPEELVGDHIRSWSNLGDLICDPMAGSGTTCLMAKLLGRRFIGVDISKQYCNLAAERVRRADRCDYEQECNRKKEKRLHRLRLRQELLAKLTPAEREILGFPRNL